MKTAKELMKTNQDMWYDVGFNNGIEELRNEAIKWVKEIRMLSQIAYKSNASHGVEIEGVEVCCDEYSCSNVKDWIIHFFNIKEAELSGD